MSTKKTIGERIREIRGLETQTEFALRLGVTQRAIVNYETRGRIPKKTILRKICEQSGVREQWLLTGEGEKHEAVVTTEPPISMAMEVEEKKPCAESIEVTKSVTASVNGHDVELIRALRENADLLRQNGDLRVDVERLRMDVERRDARIAELERQLVESLKPQNGQAMLDKRSAAAG